MKEKCQIEGCKEPAKYPIYNYRKVWLHVCKEHEQEIGDNNMRLQGYRTGEPDGS